ncbi:cytochrome P450 [Mycobacteroides abscessus]|uniref:cytochrome P450 n=1 Tax=Mycobacteroides abscessus TaxID=36809 RepID=UPI000927FB09|nr:cytochrome P450 [Mycobacteroides abscessus]SHU87341.1 cytochrome P450 Cyp136B2 family protein [Mycobacteroides abscessus subsp. bolletii]SHW22368.1 cytochrome P450 Cyp136B2 family protein [Mycobacteroides abscessus subsp. bolletii]SHW47085.1 cytochrome P450 Cyp136B2 family protein [Mycobacteroides abscessus subsp. bolletii]SHX91595.1 cytochrome P450 Cyp136B2 family protein [Mycobacteroides abscessus subsp. bolletii]SKS69413.1 cytochrome P450 Cyp136B2 family protein [Mycobacteroides abscessu
MSEIASTSPQIPALGPLDYLRLAWFALYMAPGEALGRLQDRHHAPALRMPIRVPLLFRQLILSGDPAFTEAVALNKKEDISAEGGWGVLLSRSGSFTRSILQMEFDEHRHDRLLLQQAMGPLQLSGYMQQVAPKVRAAVRACPVGDAVDQRKLFKRINMTVSIEIFMGITLPPEEVAKVGKAFDDLVGINFVGQTLARRYLHRFLLSWIPAKRTANTPDLMSQLCQARTVDGDRFSDRQIMQHMLFFLFAAHDTTTITMTNMAYYLGLNPQWQRRARAQAYALPENAGIADFGKMTELEHIMKETLRFRTPVPGMIRGAIRDTEILGYRVPRGTTILALTWSHHTNPNIWTNPRQFDPDRFSPQRAEDKDHRSKWMPFGGGVHKCIGMHFAKMQIFSVYHTLLREFEWSVDRGHILPTLQNSLAFSEGFPAAVRRFDPTTLQSQLDADGDGDGDREVGWGIAPNLAPVAYLRSFLQRWRTSTRASTHDAA